MELAPMLFQIKLILTFQHFHRISGGGGTSFGLCLTCTLLLFLQIPQLITCNGHKIKGKKKSSICANFDYYFLFNDGVEFIPASLINFLCIL